MRLPVSRMAPAGKAATTFPINRPYPTNARIEARCLTDRHPVFEARSALALNGRNPRNVRSGGSCRVPGGSTRHPVRFPGLLIAQGHGRLADTAVFRRLAEFLTLHNGRKATNLLQIQPFAAIQPPGSRARWLNFATVAGIAAIHDFSARPFGITRPGLCPPQGTSPGSEYAETALPQRCKPLVTSQRRHMM